MEIKNRKQLILYFNRLKNQMKEHKDFEGVRATCKAKNMHSKHQECDIHFSYKGFQFNMTGVLFMEHVDLIFTFVNGVMELKNNTRSAQEFVQEMDKVSTSREYRYEGPTLSQIKVQCDHFIGLFKQEKYNPRAKRL